MGQPPALGCPTAKLEARQNGIRKGSTLQFGEKREEHDFSRAVKSSEMFLDNSFRLARNLGVVEGMSYL